ncbi:hypothetical protein [Microbacterium sp. Bi121]|uniref:hypothetical protein n=1 Tax=Microbacterium sp. Bi121 TaxID=2822348 RepID=UPI001E04CD7D|nr:hypothetical protein [Microbacterium sp. Bi121]CAH0164948.1 hypothetical protein SRABI121_01598 [Microbacterium sp. Bi121]
MSTSDQQGNQPLTRKQLREIRLTGATPVIGEDEAAADAAKKTPPTPAAPLARPAEPAEVAPAPADVDIDEDSGAPLTRRQVRALERMRTASVPVIEPDAESEDQKDEDQKDEAASADADDEVDSEDVPVPVSAAATDEVVSGIPVFSTARDEDAQSARSFDDDGDDDNDDDDAEGHEDGVDEEVAERPIVSPTFGEQVLGEQTEVPSFAPSFDELITSDSGGSHRAPNTLIFTHPGGGSLSGPVASTGEVLITGTYELPEGLGSRGHARGTTDGKDIDAVLIDGELPPASSPTPIAASSAVSTIRPAGEVIRPPAPEKGNKLMLTLAITAGGLALALAVALIAAFTLNVFG